MSRPLSPKATLPQSSYLGEDSWAIVSLLAEWRDYERRGRMAQNMRPEHAMRAAKRGSWGCGTLFLPYTGSKRPFLRQFITTLAQRYRP